MQRAVDQRGIGRFASAHADGAESRGSVSTLQTGNNSVQRGVAIQNISAKRPGPDALHRSKPYKANPTRYSAENRFDTTKVPRCRLPVARPFQQDPAALTLIPRLHRQRRRRREWRFDDIAALRVFLTQGFEEAVEPAGVRPAGDGAGCCACGTHVAIIKTCSQFLVLRFLVRSSRVRIIFCASVCRLW